MTNGTIPKQFTGWKPGGVGVIIGVVAAIIVFLCLPRGPLQDPPVKPAEAGGKAPEIPPLTNAGFVLAAKGAVDVEPNNTAAQTNGVTIHRGSPTIGAKAGDGKWIRGGIFKSVPNKIDPGKGADKGPLLVGVEYLDKYSVQGNMLWDDDFLYVGAIIGDPNNVMLTNGAKINNLDLDVKNVQAQSCVQIQILNRNGTDKEVNVSALDMPTGVNNQWVYCLTLWQSADEGKVCLLVNNGLKAKAIASKVYLTSTDGKNFQGVFGHPDTHSILEAKVPWNLIGNKPYQTLRTSWKITWADSRVAPALTGTLIEVVSPAFDFTKWSMDTSQWGTAQLAKE